MNVGKTLFAQIMDFMPWTSFSRIVERHAGNAGVRRMNCAEQFRVMAFAQLTWRECLRDIEVTLNANASCTPWVCITACIAPLWPTRTKRGTSVSGPRLPRYSFAAPASFTSTRTWGWT